MAATAALPVLVLTACGESTVSITPPTPTGAAAAACTALDGALPTTVDGVASSATDPSSPYTAAWDGITLSCGGPAADVPDDAQLLAVEGVDWYPVALPQGGTRFATVGRVATVTVNVPSNHAPEANALVDLSAPVASTVPKQNAKNA